MSPLLMGGLGFAAILILVAARFPIGLALGIVSLFGVAALIGWGPAIAELGSLPYSFSSAWELSAIPMFLLMGAIAFHSGMTPILYRGRAAVAARPSRRPGGRQQFCLRGFCRRVRLERRHDRRDGPDRGAGNAARRLRQEPGHRHRAPAPGRSAR